MSRFPEKIPEFVTEALKIKISDAVPDSSGMFYASVQLRRLSKQFPKTRFIGNGRESIIVCLSGESKKIAAYSRKTSRSSLSMIAAYYSHKILFEMFPYNFPQIYLAGKMRSGMTVTKRERIFNKGNKGRKLGVRILNSQIYPYQNIRFNKGVFSRRKSTPELLQIEFIFKANGFNHFFKDLVWKGNTLVVNKNEGFYVDILRNSEVDQFVFTSIKKFEKLLNSMSSSSVKKIYLSEKDKRRLIKRFIRLKQIVIANILKDKIHGINFEKHVINLMCTCDLTLENFDLVEFFAMKDEIIRLVERHHEFWNN